MSDNVRGSVKRGRGQQSRTFNIEGKLAPDQWQEFYEKLKALLKQYELRLKKAPKG